MENEDEEEREEGCVLSSLGQRLSSPVFLRAFCLALAHDHKEEGLEGGREGGTDPRWSAGVEDLLRDAKAKWGGPVPLTRFHLSGRHFSVRHAQLVRLWLQVVKQEGGGEGGREGRLLVEAAVGLLLESTPQEHEGSFNATVAEIVAGVVSEFVRSSSSSSSSSSSGSGSSSGSAEEGGREAGRTRRRTTVKWAVWVVPVLEKVLPRLSFDYSCEWVDAFRFISQERNPRLLSPLSEWVLARIASSLGPSCLKEGEGGREGGVGDDYTAQAKWLRLLQPFLIEACGYPATRKEGQGLARRLAPFLLRSLGHPYKVCREQVAWCLFLVYGYGGVPLEEEGGGEGGVVEEVRRACGSGGDDGSSGGEGRAAGGGGGRGEGEEEDPLGLAAATAKLLKVEEEGGKEGGVPLSLTSIIPSTTSLEERTRRRETVLRWVLTSVQGGDGARYSRYVLPLLDVVYECVRDKEEEVSLLGKHAVRFLARALRFNSRMLVEAGDDATSSSFPSSSPSALSLPTHLLCPLLHLASHPSWHVKLEVTAYALPLFHAQHLPLLLPLEQASVRSLLITLLSDERREVQDAAKESLAAVLSSCELTLVDALVEMYAGKVMGRKEGGGKGKRRKVVLAGSEGGGGGGGGEMTSTAAAATAAAAAAQQEEKSTLHTSLLVLAAVVSAYPYDVPPFLPRALAVLARSCEGGGRGGGATPSMQVGLMSTGGLTSLPPFLPPSLPLLSCVQMVIS